MQEVMNEKHQIIVIGAGLTGLLLAQKLSDSGKDCLILEKSKGFGGRIATRRINEKGLDHGAAYFSSNSDFLKILSEQSLPVIETDRGLYINGGMVQIAKKLASNLNVYKEQKVISLTRSLDKWVVGTEDGSIFECTKLVLTAPVPQALELLSQSNLQPESSHLIHSIKYTKALIFLVVLKNAPEELRLKDSDGYEAIFMNQRGLHPHGLIIQMSPDFSARFFEETDATIISQIQLNLEKSGLSFEQIESYELKKWRYSLPLSTYGAPFLELFPNLFLTGDGFAHPLECAQALEQTL
jgi:predicted NAD/FAD-dependent oxidoreductase